MSNQTQRRKQPLRAKCENAENWDGGDYAAAINRFRDRFLNARSTSFERA